MFHHQYGRSFRTGRPQYRQNWPHFQPYDQNLLYQPHHYPIKNPSMYPQQWQFQNQSFYPTPYPIGATAPSQQQHQGIQSLLSQFKNEDGTVDINKMMDTAGQMMGAVNQISGLVKGISNVFKS